MTMSRRTTLAMLGLAPATAAVGAESFVAGPVDGPVTGAGTYRAEVWATALRNLADEIEKGAVSPVNLAVSAELAANNILTHKLSLEFIYAPDAEA